MNSFESHSVLFFAFYILFTVSLHCNSLSIVMCVFYLAINQSYTFNHTFPLSLEINSRVYLDGIKSKGSIISQVLHSYLQRDAARC